MGGRCEKHRGGARALLDAKAGLKAHPLHEGECRFELAVLDQWQPKGPPREKGHD
jgi:hypothetical protein